MMSNLSVAFTGQDLLADANQRLASTIPTLDTSTNTLNTTTGSLNTTMGTLNGSVQQLTTAIGSINLNPGQPTVDVTIPTAPAQGPSTSAPVQKFLGGKIQAFNKGGFVKGEPGIDRVPAMLTAGEYVLNKEQVNEVQKQGASTLAKKPAELFMDSPKQISKNIAPQKTFEENVTNKLQLFNGGVVKMLQEGGEANGEIDKKVFDLEKRVVEKQQIQAIQKKEVLKDRIVYVRHSGGAWVAAFDRRYKLVLSSLDEPWLYDLEKDPDELVNYFGRDGYEEQFKRLKDELIKQMKKFQEPTLASKKLRYK